MLIALSNSTFKTYVNQIDLRIEYVHYYVLWRTDEVTIMHSYTINIYYVSLEYFTKVFLGFSKSDTEATVQYSFRQKCQFYRFIFDSKIAAQSIWILFNMYCWCSDEHRMIFWVGVCWVFCQSATNPIINTYILCVTILCITI